MHAWIWMISLPLVAGPEWPGPALSIAPHCLELRPPMGYSSTGLLARPRPEETELLVSAPLQFNLTAGRLKPQLERLLREHFSIQHVVWQAPEGLKWTSDYQLTGNDRINMLEALLKPYQLYLQIYANHTAVVSTQSSGAAL